MKLAINPVARQVLMNSVSRIKASRWLPSPLLSVALAVLWPVLNQTWSLGHILLGVLLALVIPWLTQVFKATETLSKGLSIHKVAVALRLFVIVFKDVVMSNIDVAKLILGAEEKIKPGFVWVPLTIKNEAGVVLLASIITMTPGTLSARLSPDCHFLLVHALNLTDEAGLIESIKTRYEAPLMEIFR